MFLIDIPFVTLKVLEFEGSKTLCPLIDVDFGNSVEKIYYNIIIDCLRISRNQRRMTYPKISRSSIKIKRKRLGWGTNIHRAKVLGIVLDVFSGDFTGLAIRELLLK